MQEYSIWHFELVSNVLYISFMWIAYIRVITILQTTTTTFIHDFYILFYLLSIVPDIPTNAWSLSHEEQSKAEENPFFSQSTSSIPKLTAIKRIKKKIFINSDSNKQLYNTIYSIIASFLSRRYLQNSIGEQTPVSL